MSVKSGVSAQVISLPRGGGAVSGIGETFAPDPFTGTGTLTVPIAVPAGRNKAGPTLTLTYSTGTGNGPFGLGWSIGVPEISRTTSHGIPRYRDDAPAPSERDTFLLAGSDELVAVEEPAPGVTRFRPRTEGSFARIERVRDRGDVWMVRDRNGSVATYGTPGSDDAVVADPERPSTVFSWKVSGTTDALGNRVEYEYLRDRSTDGTRRWDQLYLRAIRYVDYAEQGRSRFLVSVTFDYAERPDPFADSRAGFEIRTRLRCRAIEVRTHPGAEEHLARRYELVYLDERVAAGELDPAVLPANGVSLLSRVRVVGHDGAETERLPPLDFGYTEFRPEGRRARPIEGTNDTLPRTSLAEDDLDLVDLFGTGLPDIVQLDGVTRFWRNLGDGRYDVPRSMPEVPVGVRLGDAGTQLGDMNGDGRADLLVLDRGGYFPLAFSGRWDPQGFVRYRSAPSVPFDDGTLRLVDLDGDGVVDALRTGTDFELFLNDPIDGWDRVETRPRGPIADFPDVTFADPRVKLADLTGDGLQDIVLVRQGRIDYWPYRGHGRWGRRVTMADSPVFRDPLAPPGGVDPARVLLGDLDGDGLDDLVYLEPNRVTVWINRGGDGWSEPVTLTGTPRFADPDAVRLVDALGTGTAGLLWTVDAPAPAPFQFADLTGGVKPYLLDRVDNNLGAVTRVTYASSTRFRMDDDADPATRWSTPLPFPVQVVARVEVADEVSGGTLRTTYRYHHGYWDGAEREFRGFGLVEQRDSEEFDRDDPVRATPPLLTRTWFHLGPVGDESGRRSEADFAAEHWPDDPSVLPRPAATEQLLRSLPATHRADALRSLRGSVLRTELYTVDGSPLADRPFTVTEAQYGVAEVAAPAAGGRRVFFPHLVAERTTQWERGHEPLHRFAFTDSYDAYGLPGRRVDLAVPRGRDFRVAAAAGEPYLGTSTISTYARRDDADRFVVDRVAATTTHEIDNDGSPALLALVDSVRAGTVRLTVTAQSLTYYDGEAFVGLPLGEVGDFGAPVRTEALVLTEEILRRAGGVPTYLVPGGPPAWPEEYPQAFRDGLPELAGYAFSPGDGARERGYFATTSRCRYDVHDGPLARGGGLPTVTRDPLGQDTTIGYDRFGLLPVEVVDPAGLSTRARYDYRVLQPTRVTDANDNLTAVSFSPLGLVTGIAVMGKAGEAVGDTVDEPGTRFSYGLSAFADSPPDRRQPIRVRTVRRVHHATDTGVPAADRDETIETVEYSDGFGRLVQTRTRAEDLLFGDPTFADGVLPTGPGDGDAARTVAGRRSGDAERPSVAVTGWQVYDNKGNVVEKYEPFLTTGWDFAPPTDDQLGQRVRMVYDPRGRVARTLYPDGSEQRVVAGVPADLSTPDRFTPTPWEAYSYDANDNAGRTHADAAAGYAHQWDTPSSIAVDALGRTVATVERHRDAPATAGAPMPPVEEIRHRCRYDLRGNPTLVIDALGRPAFRYVHDLADRPLRQESIDAGVRRSVYDAAGNDVEHRDGRGALVLRRHDRLGRLSRQWARDDGTGAVTLRQQHEYGDGGDPAQPPAERAAARAANRLGAPHRQFDEAGLLTVTRYDFRGNAEDKVRQVIADHPILAVFPALFRVDWEPPAGSTVDAHAAALLDPTGYQVSAGYDALNRATVVRYPRDADGERKQLRAEYNASGTLERVSLGGRPFVEHAAYNARGQRTLLARADGVLTRYAYHPATLRLARLRSERFTRPATTTYRPVGAALQDLAYDHDLVGNVLTVVERTPGSGVAANPDAGTVPDPALRELVARGDALVRRYRYDSLYRLTSATGRECAGAARSPLWTDTPGCGFDAATTPGNASRLTAAYRERYAYDAVGNLTRWTHTGGDGDTARRFALEPGTNRLRALTAGGTTADYTTDANGNVTGETTSRHFEWDSGDRLRVFRTQAGAAEPSVHAQYLYDADGERVKKVVRKQGGAVAVTTYVDGIFERHRRSAGAESAAGVDYLHVMDDRQRLGLVRVGTPPPEDRGPAVQHHLGDHLGSGSVVVDAEGGFVNREEYAPYGETTFGSFGRKRYRFTGGERDEESGLTYHGARYYAPWLARWRSCDPAGPTGGANLYAYAAGNPVLLADPDGMQPRTMFVDAEDVPEPPPELTLPTADPDVELQTDGGSQATKLSRLRASPGYVDNWERFEAQPDPLTLQVSEITFHYAGGNALRVPMSAIDSGPGSRSTRYKASAGLILPLGSSGQVALDTENTPAIAAAAGYVRQELGQRSATRLELAEITFQYAMAVGSLAAAWSPLPSLRTPVLPGGGPRQLPLSTVTEAEIDAAVNARMSSRYFFRTPVEATEAGHAVESLVPASRWGRSGLKPGDWLMGGPPNRSNWLRSFKWEPNPTNIRAPFRAGEGYMVPRQYVTWPRGPIGWIKGLFGQRKYTPR